MKWKNIAHFELYFNMTLEIHSSLLAWPLKTLHLTSPLLAVSVWFAGLKPYPPYYFMNLLLLWVSIGPPEGGGRRRQSLCWHVHQHESQRNNCPTHLKLPRQMLSGSVAYKCRAGRVKRWEGAEKEEGAYPHPVANWNTALPPCCLIITTRSCV